jgi:hypothetical protein
MSRIGYSRHCSNVQSRRVQDFVKTEDNLSSYASSRWIAIVQTEQYCSRALVSYRYRLMMLSSRCKSIEIPCQTKQIDGKWQSIHPNHPVHVRVHYSHSAQAQLIFSLPYHNPLTNRSLLCMHTHPFSQHTACHKPSMHPVAQG